MLKLDAGSVPLMDGPVEEQASFFATRVFEAPLDEAADAALKARQAIDKVGGNERLGLRIAVDRLLLAIGFALASRDRLPHGEMGHGGPADSADPSADTENQRPLSRAAQIGPAKHNAEP